MSLGNDDGSSNEQASKKTTTVNNQSVEDSSKTGSVPITTRPSGSSISLNASKFPIPSTNNIRRQAKPVQPGTGSGSGINAVHVSAAREMVQLHTRGRAPPGQQLASLSQSQVHKKLQFPVPSRPTNSLETGPLSPKRGSTSSNVMHANSSSSSFPKNVSIPAKSHEGECTNPQCAHCGQVIIPSPKSSFPIQDKPSISVNDWSIFTIKKPILNSPELDYLNDNRFDFPLPEMIFGNNHVKLVNEKLHEVIEFNALDALDSLEAQSNLKVSYHKEWLSSRRSTSSPNSDALDKSEKALKDNSNRDLKKLTDLESVKPYDWTYSTNYKGTLENIKFYPTNEKIPIDRLLRPDPILFFDESILFEDELGDNGISILSTKIRVMPLCLLLLCRFFLRIDNVIFRVRDTRIFIDLETNSVLREYKEQECPYDELLRKVGSKNSNDPKSLLRDTNWVAQNIPVLKVETESNVPPVSSQISTEV